MTEQFVKRNRLHLPVVDAISSSQEGLCVAIVTTWPKNSTKNNDQRIDPNQVGVT